MKVTPHKNEFGDVDYILITADEGRYITTNEKNVENFDEEQRLFWKEMICPKDCDQAHLRDADQAEKDAWIAAHPPKHHVSPIDNVNKENK